MRHHLAAEPRRIAAPQGVGAALRGVQRAPAPPRRARLAVSSVLQEDPPAVRKQQALQPASSSGADALLPPSLRRLAAEQPDLAFPRLPVRRLTNEPGHVWYFSYGANMSFSVLSRRGVVTKQRCPAAVVDPGLSLVFQHRGGYSTLAALPPGSAARYRPYLPQVHGVLYQVAQDDMAKLKKAEGGYDTMEVEVETYDGWRVNATTFVSSPLAQLQHEVTPTEKYMRVLRDGAADNYLDPLYQAWLSSIETVPSAGLGPEYYETPAKWMAYGFLGIVGLVVVGFFSQH